MQIKALASGSNGNSILVRSVESGILIDAGISCKRITAECEKAGVRVSDLKALLLTHEHSDHIMGLQVFLKHNPLPVYAGQGTIREILSKNETLDPMLFHPVEPYVPFTVGDLRILPIRTFHDAADPLAFRVDAADGALAVVTDTGCCTEEMLCALRDLSCLLLESNHDIRMVEAGSYPYPLKRRILSDHGHLSNERCSEVLCKLLNPRLKLVLLGHLSEENNYPDIAMMTVENALREVPKEELPEDLRVIPLSRYESSELFEI